MIYPTGRAVAVAAAGVPVAVAGSVLGPGVWLVGVAWAVLTVGLIVADGLLGASRSRLKLQASVPGHLAIGGRGEAAFEAQFSGYTIPRVAEFTVDADARLDVEPQRRTAEVAQRLGVVHFALSPLRRGLALVPRVWVRWHGPLGLVWKQRVDQLDSEVAVTPNIAAVKDEALRLIARNTLFGLHMQLNLGESAEFHALTDFRAGMDRRAIDWKQSARHHALLAREYRAESNQHVVLVLDSGRLMSEPIRGQPRLDRALQAALLLAYAGLKMGDRVGLFAFDERTRVSSGTVAGAGAFPLLQRLAANIDYSSNETNFTLGLTQLGGELERRSLVVIFTEFADTTSAELMIENIERLLRRHLVLFVVFRDEEVEAMTAREPVENEDVSRAVIADALLKEREVVISRLRRMGVHVVHANAERMSADLLNAYLQLKRRDLL